MDSASMVEKNPGEVASILLIGVEYQYNQTMQRECDQMTSCVSGPLFRYQFASHR